MARALGADLPASIWATKVRSFGHSIKAASKIAFIAGTHPHGTNAGLATFMQMIQAEGKIPLSRWRRLIYAANPASRSAAFISTAGR